MHDDLILLWLAAAPLMMSPGPATLSVAGVAVAYGIPRGARFILGVAAGTASVLALVAGGLAAFLRTAPSAAGALAVLGALYILYLAYRIATAPTGGRAVDSQPPPSFRAGYLLAVANPKAFAAFGAVYSTHQIGPTATIAALSALILVSCGFWAFSGAALARLLRRPVLGRLVNLALALTLLISVGATARELAEAQGLFG